MPDVSFHIVDAFPEPDWARLRREVFADYAPSQPLAQVMAEEKRMRGEVMPSAPPAALRIIARRGDGLVGWTYGVEERKNHFLMVNSGVAAECRRMGIYTQLVRRVIDHARSSGYATIDSRHVADNVAVIIPKLKLGFRISGFEYSEVYGPLVRLTYTASPLRQDLYRVRAMPIRPADE